jgi:hypothetical protein
MTEIGMRDRIAERLMQHYAEGGPWDGFMEADIVLEMLAEPTPGMRTAAFETAQKFNKGRSKDHIGSVAFDSQSIYRAMIKAARAGK